MSILLGGLFWLLTIGGGAAAVGHLRGRLLLEERVALSVLAGFAGSSLLGFLLSLPFGVNPPVALGGPLLLLALALAGWPLLGSPATSWRRSWAAAMERWRARPPWVLGITMLVATAFFVVVFRHALFSDGSGGLLSGWSTAWADWSLHATMASSFAYGHDPAGQNVIYAATPQLYPFLPDFQSAMLLTLGWDLPAALIVPGTVIAITVVLLIVCLAGRLTGSHLVGSVAAAICILGGGIGFVGSMTDACSQSLTGAPYPPVHRADSRSTPDQPQPGSVEERCSLAHLTHDPRDAVSVFRQSLVALPGVLRDQPHQYDGLLVYDDPQRLLTNQQWYTPLLDWWIPQRNFTWGFGIGLSVLLLLWVAVQEEPARFDNFVAAGALAGVLPLIHVHSLIVLALVLPFMFWRWRQRWREWAAAAVTAAVLALPRMVQLLSGPHGVPNYSAFPRIEPGWLAYDQGSATAPPLVRGLFALSPGWWGFWVSNTGVLLPLTAVVLVAVALRLAPLPDVAGLAIRRLLRPFPPALLRFTLPFSLVFVVGNLVVFQSWNWDNTKLFAYWLLGAGLLGGALIVHCWRRGLGGALLGAGLLASLVLTGVLSTWRLLPESKAAGGPYAWVSGDEVAVAAQIRSTVPDNAVILTPHAVQDPAALLAGRTTVLGFPGWIYSYGYDYQARQTDVATMYRGCPAASTGGCDALGMMRQYHVSFAEIWDSTPNGGEPAPDPAWWRRFPVVARGEHIVVYDVRGA